MIEPCDAGPGGTRLALCWPSPGSAFCLEDLRGGVGRPWSVISAGADGSSANAASSGCCPDVVGAYLTGAIGSSEESGAWVRWIMRSISVLMR